MKRINKNIKSIFIVFILCICLIVIYFWKNKETKYNEIDTNILINEENKENVILENEKNLEETDKIIVYITGEIKKAGIYEVSEKSRISDVIEIAGGTTENANLEKINLAYVVEDAMKIYIPPKSENIENITKIENEQDETTNYIMTDSGLNSNTSTKSTNKTNKININTATQSELETLPGIGPSTATKIINFRKEKGKFKNIEDIKNVSGIGESKYSKIKENICV